MLLTSCASYKVNNINVYDKQLTNPMSKKEGKALINSAIRSTKILGFTDSDKFFKNWDIIFMSDWLGIYGPNNTIGIADGVTNYENKIIYLKVHDCFWHSAILHEMMHALIFHKTGSKESYYHPHKGKIWNKVKSLNIKIRKKMCPLDYNPRKQAPRKVKRI